MFENGQVYGGNSTVIPNYGNYGNQQQVQMADDKYNNQLLTKKQMDELRAKPASVRYKINYTNFLSSQCTHKNENRNITINSIEPNEKGHNVQCSVCGETWKMIPLDTPVDDIRRMVDNVISILHSIKAYTIYTPQDASNVYACIAMLKLVPDIWTHATTSFGKTYNNMSNTNQNQTRYADDQYPSILGQLFASFGGQGGFMDVNNNAYTNMINPSMNINNGMMGGTPMAGGFRRTPDGRVVDAYGLPVDPSARYDDFGRRIGMVNDTMNVETPPMAQYSQNTAQTRTNDEGMNISPIGYVEDMPKDFTDRVQTTNQTVSVPGVAGVPDNVAQSVPPMPEAPKNPNLKNGGFPA